MEMSTTSRSGRLTALVAAGLFALSGAAGLTACGDDKEGPAEDVGKELDKAGREAGEELDEAGKDADKELNDGKGE